jgi:hypothetical protein
VLLHGVLADEQSFGDLTVVQARRDQAQHLELTFGQPEAGHLVLLRMGHLLNS